ncbi:MAG: DUF3592 domain-containing protein [Verrucomicrobiaceae bacterium]|nr:DUF3592 domain-containing protein [Verrucomicrobiaceae bacterium]
MKRQNRPPKSAGKIILAISIIFALMSLVFVFVGIGQLKLERRYETEGATAEGMIVSKRVDEKHSLDRETKRPVVTRSYFMTVRFPLERGHEVEAETSISQERWQTAQENASITVQYLTAAPTTCREVGASGKVKAYAFTTLGVVGVFIGLGGLVRHFLKKD